MVSSEASKIRTNKYFHFHFSVFNRRKNGKFIIFIYGWLSIARPLLVHFSEFLMLFMKSYEKIYEIFFFFYSETNYNVVIEVEKKEVIRAP